jgi:hypothetical protein
MYCEKAFRDPGLIVIVRSTNGMVQEDASQDPWDDEEGYVYSKQPYCATAVAQY